MNKFPQDELEDRAFHEAGHVAAAHQLSISVRSVSIVTVENQPPGVRFAPLRELCKTSAGSPTTRRTMQDYATVRLAGPITEMTNAGLRAKRRYQTVVWPVWQELWKGKLVDSEDIDLDIAFAIAFGWSRCDDEDLLVHVSELWERTLRMVREKETWRQIRRLAEKLLETDELPSAC